MLTDSKLESRSNVYELPAASNQSEQMRWSDASRHVMVGLAFFLAAHSPMPWVEG